MKTVLAMVMGGLLLLGQLGLSPAPTRVSERPASACACGEACGQSCCCCKAPDSKGQAPLEAPLSLASSHQVKPFPPTSAAALASFEAAPVQVNRLLTAQPADPAGLVPVFCRNCSFRC